jgi:hypothetical protein
MTRRDSLCFLAASSSFFNVFSPQIQGETQRINSKFDVWRMPEEFRGRLTSKAPIPSKATSDVASKPGKLANDVAEAPSLLHRDVLPRPKRVGFLLRTQGLPLHK